MLYGSHPSPSACPPPCSHLINDPNVNKTIKTTRQTQGFQRRNSLGVKRVEPIDIYFMYTYMYFCLANISFMLCFLFTFAVLIFWGVYNKVRHVYKYKNTKICQTVLFFRCFYECLEMYTLMYARSRGEYADA